jgi:hypothetical protein
VKEIARALDVDAVVERSVLRAGSHVRITAQLIDARDDKHLWAESFEGDLKDVLALQSDVATSISKRLHLALNTNSSAPIVTTARKPGGPRRLPARQVLPEETKPTRLEERRAIFSAFHGIGSK